MGDSLDGGIWYCMLMRLAPGIAAGPGILGSLGGTGVVSGCGWGVDWISRMVGFEIA